MIWCHCGFNRPILLFEFAISLPFLPALLFTNGVEGTMEKKNWATAY